MPTLDFPERGTTGRTGKVALVAGNVDWGGAELHWGTSALLLGRATCQIIAATFG